MKPSNLLILGTATIIYLTICIFQIVSLSGKSYVLTKSDLFPIDSVRMLSRAYKGGVKTTSDIYFDDETYKTFWITGSRYHAIADTEISSLYDTLQYSDLVMKIYTDKEGYKNYFDKNNKGKIEVYGIEIGGREYISLAKVNKEEREGKNSILIFFTIAYCIFVLIHFVRVLRMTKSVQQAVLQ